MQTETLTAADGTALYTARWTVSTPKAGVFIAHGIGEHSGRYAHVAAFLNAQGFSVYAIDHRGHGQSSGERTHFDSFEQPVADLHRALDLARTNLHAAQPQAKLFLFGHSMGSLITTLYVLKHPEWLAGYVSSGSPLMIDSTQPAAVRLLGQVMQHIAPKLRFVALDTAGLSHDPAVITAYESDPLVDHAPVRIGIGTLLMQRAIYAREQVQHITLPLLLMHGSDDPLTPLSGSQWFYEHAGSTDKTLKVYEGMYHEVHNETEPTRTQMLTDLAEWLSARA